MKITVQDYRRTQTKHRKAKKGHGWTKLERIEMDCIWVICLLLQASYIHIILGTATFITYLPVELIFETSQFGFKDLSFSTR